MRYRRSLTESFDYFQPYVAEFFRADLNVLREKKISYVNLPEEWKDREIAFYRAYFDKIVPDLGHIYNGYKYMKRIGFAAVAKVCLTHSFPAKDASV